MHRVLYTCWDTCLRQWRYGNYGAREFAACGVHFHQFWANASDHSHAILVPLVRVVVPLVVIHDKASNASSVRIGGMIRHLTNRVDPTGKAKPHSAVRFWKQFGCPLRRVDGLLKLN